MQPINNKFKYITLFINYVLINNLCYSANYVANDGGLHDLSTDTYSTTVTGLSNSALTSSNGSTINGTDLNLSSSFQQASGAFAITGGQINLKDSTIYVTSTPGSGTNLIDQTYGILAYGETTTRASSVVVDGGSITVENTNNHGVLAYLGGKIDLKNGAVINTTGNTSVGIFSAGIGQHSKNVSLITANNIIINTTGQHAYGAHTRASGAIELINSRINTSGIGAMGIFAAEGGHVNATNITIITSGDSAFGAAVANATMSLDNVTINTTGVQSNGIAVGDTSNANIKNSEIKVTGQNAYALMAQQNTGTINVSNTSLLSQSSIGVAVLNGKSNINLDNSTTVNSGIGRAIVVANIGTEANISLNNNTVVNGTATSAAGAILNLSINTNSVLNSNTSNVNELNLSSSGRWTITADNSIQSMNNTDGLVQFNSNSFSTPITLTMKDLSGAGTFSMKTDIGNLTGDLLEITGNSSGSHKLAIANNGASITNGTEELIVVKTADGISDFSLKNAVEAGGYQYRLIKDGTNWKLYAAGRALTSTANAGVSFFNTGYLSNYIENQTLLQRLGDLRNPSEKTHTGFWLRSYGGKLNSFSGQGVNGFDMSYLGNQGGIDTKLELNNADLILGGVVGYTRGNPNYQEGNGTLKNYHVGLYATYYHHNGIYLDTLLKYNSTHNHFSVKDTSGIGVKGKSKTQGYTASLELGKRFTFNQQKNGIYIEPQAQLTYGYQNSDRVHASNSLKIDLRSYNTTQGRLGLNLGYQATGQTPFNIYLKANLYREMDGNTAYKLNGNKHSYSFKGNWRSGGIGANINLNKNHNIYLDAEYAKGEKFQQRQLNLGYSYRF